MNNNVFHEKVKNGVSLRQMNDPAPTHNEKGEEDWEPELERLQEKAKQEALKTQADKRVEEIYYDSHTRSKLNHMNQYKVWRIKFFLYSPLLQTIQEET